MKKKLIALSLCGILLMTTACGSAKLKNGEEVVASVKGYEVSADELYKELKGSYGYEALMNKINAYIANKEVKTTKEIEDYANQIVEYYKQYATQYGVDFEQFMTNYVGLNGVTTEDQLFDYAVNDRKIAIAAAKQIGTKYTDKEIEDYYNDNYSEKLTVKHILIEFDEDQEDDTDEAYDTATDLIDQLKDIKDNDKLNEKFDELALNYSADSSYENGGLIENFMKGDVVEEFWDASAKLKNGQVVSEPVKTEYGYHVILKVSSADKDSLKDATDDIRIKMAEQEMSSDTLLQSTALHELREKYKFTINDSNLKQKYKDFINSLNSDDTTTDDEEE